MSYKQVEIEFNLSHKKLKTQILKFWTCVLQTDVERLDYGYLTQNTKSINLGIADFYVSANFSNFDGKIDENLKVRNPVFLTIDKNSTNGSPYISSCAELVNYYDIDFSVKYMQFLANIELETKIDFSEYEKFEIQKQTINAINTIIGINILNQESIPGSVSVYKRFPKFELDANYNIKKGCRYIKFSFEPEKNCDYLLEIEIPDEKKILYKQIHSLKPNDKILLPEQSILEPFGQVHLSIFKQKNLTDSGLETSIVYEEGGHLIRSFSFGINTGGGNYKLIQNRFSGKKIEKVALTQHSVTNSDKKGLEPYQLEREYKYNLFGKDKKFLETQFFSDDDDGRKSFLDWTRNVLQRAKEVTIIDPFFDLNGFNDFNTCATTYFSLSVLTTDPAQCPRDNQNKGDNNSENLVKLITQSFQNAKLYYVDRAKLHDRYLIVFDGDDTTYYNLSNSWNGTVNNYSLFVQELELSIALQVKDCYSKFLDDKYLQNIEISEVNNNKEKQKNKKSISEKKIRKQLKYFTSIKKTINNKKYIASFCDLFNADYYGSEVIDEFELLPLCISKLRYVKNIEKFIHILVFKILNEQKNCFLKEQKLFSNDKSLSSYTEISECMRIASSRHFCSGIPYHDLRIDYSQYKILESSFAIVPAVVIKELCEQEKDVCILNKNTKNEIKYFVSEQIVSYMLSENFRYFPEQHSVDLVDFANKSENFYCKVYIALWILDTDDAGQEFENKLANLLKLNISNKDFAVLLGSFCAELLRINNEKTRAKKDAVISFISKNYAQNTEFLILFALHAYLSSYEINFEEYRAFLNNNQNVERDLNVLFLLFSLNSVPSKKLFLLLEEHIDKSLFVYLPKCKENPRIADVGKYINCIPFIGQTLFEIIKESPELKKNLVYKFDFYPNFIFEINAHPSDEFDCYVLLIILNTLYLMKKQGNDVSEQINSIKWYMPYLLNMHNNDYYGLSLKILDVYATFLTDSEKDELKDKLISEKLKVFLITTLPNEINGKIGQIQKLVDDYSFDQYDKTNSIIYLLALFFNLVFYSDSVDYDKKLFSLLSNIKNKFMDNIQSQKIQNCIEKGIVFYLDKTEGNKDLFIKEIMSLYCPYTVCKYVEDRNE